MSIGVLKYALGRRPFEPFRIRLSIGDVYDVRHLEAALLLRGGIYVALSSSTDDQSDLAERAVDCPLSRIAAVETLANA